MAKSLPTEVHGSHGETALGVGAAQRASATPGSKKSRPLWVRGKRGECDYCGAQRTLCWWKPSHSLGGGWLCTDCRERYNTRPAPQPQGPRPRLQSTPELLSTARALIADGQSVSGAARRLGLHPSTLHDWLNHEGRS
jgi:hypothetical protein